MTRLDIIRKVSEGTSITQKQVDKVICALCESISNHMVSHEKVYFRGFGTFGTKVRRARTARNLNTNEKLHVPEHSVPYFQMGKSLKEIKNKTKAGYDSVKKVMPRQKIRKSG